jgi:hypothetical protein
MNTYVLKIYNCNEYNNMKRKYNQPSYDKNKIRRVAPPRRQFTIGYQNLFVVLLFLLKQFWE